MSDAIVDAAIEVGNLIDKMQEENDQLRFNLREAYNRIELLKKQVLELELAAAIQPE